MRTATAPTALQPLSRFSAGVAIGALVVACCFKVASADAATLAIASTPPQTLHHNEDSK